MTIIDKYLIHTCTYWSPAGVGADGRMTFAAPVVLDCRWDDIQEIVPGLGGVDTISQARVYLGQDVEMEGYLYKGTSSEADPTGVEGAKQIVAFTNISDLHNSTQLRKCWLIGRHRFD